MLRFDVPARELADRIRGLWSWPGGACLYEPASGRPAERVCLARAVPADAATQAEGPLDPGTLDPGLRVAASPGLVEVLEVKPASGRLMAWRDFVNGRHVRPGDRFRPPPSGPGP